MDFSYYKYLFYANKKSKISRKQLQNDFNLDNNDTYNILNTLSDNGYIKFSYDVYYQPTYKGKHLIKSFITKWLYTNLLAIIAIIISIIALFK